MRRKPVALIERIIKNVTLMLMKATHVGFSF